MNFGDIVIRTLFLVGMVGALVACQQESEPDLPEAEVSIASLTPKTTQRQPEAETPEASSPPPTNSITQSPTVPQLPTNSTSLTDTPLVTTTPEPASTPFPTDTDTAALVATITTAPTLTASAQPSNTPVSPEIATSEAREGRIIIGSPENLEEFTTPFLALGDLDEEGQLDQLISNSRELEPASGCPDIWIEPHGKNVGYSLFLPLAELDGFVVGSRLLDPEEADPYAIVQIGIVEVGANPNVLIIAPEEGRLILSDLEIIVLIPGCKPYSVLTTEIVIPAPAPCDSTVIKVTPPPAKVLAEARYLGIEHLQIGQEAALVGDSWSIAIFNEPGGDCFATETMGSTVTVRDFTVHDDVYWYLVDTIEGESGWISELGFVPLNGEISFVTPEALTVAILPQLITSSDLEEISSEILISQWQLASETANRSKACRVMYGLSWSVNPNRAVNCIIRMPVDLSFEEKLETLVNQEIIHSTAMELPIPPQFDKRFEGDVVIFGDKLENGHAVFDLFVDGGDVLHWSSVSIAISGGDTVANTYMRYGTAIETFLHDIVAVNVERGAE